ncbi:MULTISPECIES: universal stress protein [Asticcacaulis]|jgi:nucleotide-binding universal stress UspA family protein|uniref:UspA domain-containing protein n=3 Tax=Asticcacaulis TaxID=76890 RepID=E8RNU8_ASTEC|nr:MULTISPECIES: universal stress protein [Asticcacaulis]ADU11861.1 UspA domain-containing protein [Asticcacaulis excentricus CB 48]BBF81167.1 universal stress protein UspA [Asticcacaulis excentricus]BEV09589.1 universal stress protein [Asticcacaulis sp. DW145]
MRKFLVIADDSAEFRAALSYASVRARVTQGMVTLLRVLPPTDYSQWAGVRDEIEREQREEAETLLSTLSDEAAVKSGRPAEIIIKTGQMKDAIREVLIADRDIKIIVIGASGGNPGPLVNLLVREGVGTLGGTRPVPVTVVPGDISDEAIEELM